MSKAYLSQNAAAGKHENMERTKHFGGTSGTVLGTTSVCSLHFVSPQCLAECETNIGDKKDIMFLHVQLSPEWILDPLDKPSSCYNYCRKKSSFTTFFGDATGSVVMLLS